jgi:putative serine protease PepD
VARDDDEGGFSPPPPRDQRRWVHPSELASAAAAAPLVPPATRRRTRRVVLPRTRPTTLGPTVLVVVALGASVLGAGVALAGAAALGAFADAPERIVEGGAVPAGVVGDLTDTETVARIVDAVEPSVVGIRVTTPDGVARGSGVAIRANGLVATTAPLVAAVGEGGVVEVTDWRGRVHAATVVGADADSGVALLDVDADFLPVAPLATEGPSRLGEMAIVVGAPGPSQVSGTASLGIVSSLGRVVSLDGTTPMLGLAELDQALPQHALGGAVLDRGGAVVGIALPSLQGSFVVPVETVRSVVGELLATGEVAWAWLGVEQGTDLGVEQARSEGVVSGAVVGEVWPGSSADRAGLRPGDVIVQVDGHAVTGINDLITEIRARDVGSTVILTVSRDGSRSWHPVELEERPPGR